MNKLILLIFCGLTVGTGLWADPTSNAKGVMILTSASGIDPRNILFSDQIWTGFDGGEVVDTGGQKTDFAKRDIGKVIYFDSNFYSQLDNDQQEKAFRAGIQAREVVVDTSFLNLDTSTGLKTVQDSESTLESLVHDYPAIQSLVQPQIDRLKDDITKLSAGQSLQDGTWLAQGQAARQGPPTIGGGPKTLTFTTKDGKKYVNARVDVTDTGISVLTADGGTTIPFDQLPDDLSGFPESVRKLVDQKRQAAVAEASISASDTQAQNSGDAGIPPPLAKNVTYTTIDPPGSVSARAISVDGNNVLGDYRDSNGTQHGYIYNLSSLAFTTFDPPGTFLFEDWGHIYGNYVIGNYKDSDGTSCGYLYNISNGTYTTLDPPFGSYINAIGISGNSVIGTYSFTYQAASLHDMHGYFYNIDTGIYSKFGPITIRGNNLLFNSVPLAISGNNVMGLCKNLDMETQHAWQWHFYLTNGTMDKGSVHTFVGSDIGKLGDKLCTFSLFDWPEQTDNIKNLFGISGDTMVGGYANKSGNDTWFTYNISSNTYTTISLVQYYPKIKGVSDNMIVGIYNHVPFYKPATVDNLLNDINSTDGYVYNITNGRYATLHVPGSKVTSIFGISGNKVVGVYATVSFTSDNDAHPLFHSFIATIGSTDTDNLGKLSESAPQKNNAGTSEPTSSIPVGGDSLSVPPPPIEIFKKFGPPLPDTSEVRAEFDNYPTATAPLPDGSLFIATLLTLDTDKSKWSIAVALPPNDPNAPSSERARLLTQWTNDLQSLANSIIGRDVDCFEIIEEMRHQPRVVKDGWTFGGFKTPENNFLVFTPSQFMSKSGSRSEAVSENELANADNKPKHPCVPILPGSPSYVPHPYPQSLPKDPDLIQQRNAEFMRLYNSDIQASPSSTQSTNKP